MKFSRVAALTLITSGFLVGASVVFAIDGSPSGKPPLVRPSTKSGESPFRANPRACQAKEAAVKQRSLQLTKIALNMEDRFATIAGRVEDFYTKQASSGGKIVPNYAVLVADIAAKKTAVSAALTVAQTDAANFSCTGNDPKGQLVKFHLDMKAVKEALKNYRASVKNLIVAVRTAVGKGNSNE